MPRKDKERFCFVFLSRIFSIGVNFSVLLVPSQLLEALPGSRGTKNIILSNLPVCHLCACGGTISPIIWVRVIIQQFFTWSLLMYRGR